MTAQPPGVSPRTATAFPPPNIVATVAVPPAPVANANTLPDSAEYRCIRACSGFASALARAARKRSATANKLVASDPATVAPHFMPKTSTALAKARFPRLATRVEIARLMVSVDAARRADTAPKIEVAEAASRSFPHATTAFRIPQIANAPPTPVDTPPAAARIRFKFRISGFPSRSIAFALSTTVAVPTVSHSQISMFPTCTVAACPLPVAGKNVPGQRSSTSRPIAT